MEKRKLAMAFTGTRQGMTSAQELEVSILLRDLKPTSVHHGDCIGADADFHRLVLQELGKELPYIHIHPGRDARGASPHRAYCSIPSDQPRMVWAARPYLKRNEEMVNVCHILIATPDQDHMVMRSGTWSTIRKAIDARRELRVILPDGSHLTREDF